MNRRRVAALAAAGLAVLVPLLVAPAARAESIRGGVTSPEEGATLATSTPRLAASFAHSDGTIDGVTLDVVAERGDDRQSKSEPGNGRSSVAVEWVPQLAYNGRYTLTATATGSHPPPSTPLEDQDPPPPAAQAVRTFFLAAPPAVPADVTASESSGNITVRWTANTEPDLVGYQIERAPARTTDFRAVGISTGARFVDDAIPDPGRYVYRVIAVRQGAKDEGVASEPSSESRAVEVTPPPTTTTAPDDDDDGDGDNGGSGSATTAPSGGGSSSAPPVRRSGTVDLSGFRTLLDENTTPPPGEVDPGFQQTLPFDGSADEEIEDPGDEPEMEIGLGEPLDPSADQDAERRRSLAFIAGGLLMFILLMGTLFVRGEVARSEQLGMDPVPVDQP